MCSNNKESNYAHFKGKDAVGHVAEAQAQGFISSVEIHGLEPTGFASAAADTARNSAVALLLIWIVLAPLPLTISAIFTLLALFSAGWIIWQFGRSAWLGWSRLERLHRVLEQERWEIEHHRTQEREELKELYAAKGFEGKLLEDVLDVLMADDNRLLHVMVEEELGLSLASQEHPLKQGLGALVGGILAALLILILFQLYPALGIAIGAFLVLGISGAISAKLARNRIIPAICWNVGLGMLSAGFSYFILQLVLLQLRK